MFTVEFATFIRSASEEWSENNLTLENIKNWLTEYVRMRNDEIAQFPKEKDLPHWDLLMADYDSSREAMFVLAFFQGDKVTLLAGRGSIPGVRDFGENSFPKNVHKVIDDLSGRFWIAGSVMVDHDELVRWLNS